jgi:hypothetical protein
MMKRILIFMTVLASAGLLNGCSKCSRDEVPPADAPPAMEEPATNPAAPDEQQPGMEAPAEGEPATPAVPPAEEGQPGSTNESTD